MLKEYAQDFDVTFRVSEKVDVKKIAEFCGEEWWEFSLLEDKTGHTPVTLIRVRK